MSAAPGATIEPVSVEHTFQSVLAAVDHAGKDALVPVLGDYVKTEGYHVYYQMGEYDFSGHPDRLDWKAYISEWAERSAAGAKKK